METNEHRENLQGVNEVAFGDPGPLSPREHEAVVCVAEGLTSKAVAQVMGCTVRTANSHIENSMNKLGAKNRVHLVWLASSKGLIVPAGFAVYWILLMNMLYGFLMLFIINCLVGTALSQSLVPSEQYRRPSNPLRIVRTVRAARTARTAKTGRTTSTARTARSKLARREVLALD